MGVFVDIESIVSMEDIASVNVGVDVLASGMSSVVGSVFLVILCFTGNAPLPYAWFGVIGTILIAFRHKDNILRLIKGQERKLGQKI